MGTIPKTLIQTGIFLSDKMPPLPVEGVADVYYCMPSDDAARELGKSVSE